MEKEKNIDINIQAAIPSSRGIGSLVGSLVGQAYNKVESKTTWPGGDQGWDADNQKVRDGISKMLIPNRKITKYSIRGINIRNACYITRPMTGEVGIAINLNEDKTFDYFFPLDKDVYNLVKSTPEAIQDALRGEGENFFLNPIQVAAVLNDANQANINACKALIKILQDSVQSLTTTMRENTAKAQKFQKEMTESKVESVNFKDLLKDNAVSAMVEVSATSGAEQL